VSKSVIRPRDLKRIELALISGRELAAELRQAARDLHVRLDTLSAALASYRQVELPFATPESHSVTAGRPPKKRTRALKLVP
jgi:hypothetical protein